MVKGKKVESFVAVGSFVAAVALAFTSLMISEEHDIASGVLMMCAQFLMLTATIFGLDLRLWTHFNRLEIFREYGREEEKGSKGDKE